MNAAMKGRIVTAAGMGPNVAKFVTACIVITSAWRPLEASGLDHGIGLDECSPFRNLRHLEDHQAAHETIVQHRTADRHLAVGRQSPQVGVVRREVLIPVSGEWRGAWPGRD